MVLEMALCNAESSSFMAERKRKRKRKRGNGEHNALCNNNDRRHNCSENTSEIPLETDSHVESTVNISSESGLTEALSNSNSNCLKKKNKKKKKKMMINDPKTNNTDVDLQGVTSEAMIAPFRTEAPVDVSMKKVSETSPFEVDVIVDTSTKMDLVATTVKVGSFLNNNNNGTSQNCPKGASLMQGLPLGRDSFVESMVKLGSESGLMEAQSNSNLDCLHNEKKKKRPKKKKRLNAPKTDDIDANLQVVTSETITAPLLIEASVDVNVKKVPETAPSKVEVMFDTSPKMDLVATPVKVGSFLNNNNNNDTSHDYSKGASSMQEIPLGRDSYVESVVKVGSESGFIEAQSNSNLDCLHNEKKKKRPKKKKRLNAPKTDYIDVNRQEVTSETITAPLGTEASVDVSIKKVPEIATGEAEGMFDTSTKMELVATPVIIGPMNLSRLLRKRMRKKKKKENLNDSVTTDMFPERDSSLQLPVNICSSNVSVEKQPNEDISWCLEKNGRNKQNDGHNASENYSPAHLQMANAEHFGKEDVKIAPEELDLASMKGDLRFSRNQSGSLKSTNLMEKQDLPSENDIVCRERSDAKTYHRKRKRKSSKSLVNSSDCIKDGKRDTLFDHSEEAHTVDLIENKLDRVIEVENAASAQVLGDIEMREASVNSLEGQPACKDSEKKMKMKNLQRDVTEDSLTKNVSVHLEEKNIEKAGEIQIPVQNASCKDGGSVESSSGSKEKTSDNISDHDTCCKHQKQKNLKLETKTKEIAPSSLMVVIKDDCSVNETNKEENSQHSSHSIPIRACIGHSKKKLLVLDVNGILAAITQHPARKGWKPHYVASRKAVFKRPYCRDFLQFCFERFNVGIWTSRIKRNVEGAVQFLLGGFKHRLLFCWDASHCSKTGLTAIENKNKPLVLKELKKLWVKTEHSLPWRKGEYNETNTLLVDDSPYKALRNPAYTAIFPYSYQYWDTRDKSLGPGGDIREYLERLSHAENVQEFVRQNPFGQPPINESNPHWSYYSQVLCTKSSGSHNVGNTSLGNTNEDHKIPQQTVSQIVSDPQ